MAENWSCRQWKGYCVGVTSSISFSPTLRGPLVVLARILNGVLSGSGDSVVLITNLPVDWPGASRADVARMPLT